MPIFSPLVDQLIQSLQCLPGVGSKTAQRMALYLLERNRQGGEHLALSLASAMQNVKSCQRCRNFCESELCTICLDNTREEKVLCVVETPADLISIEQAGGFGGRYFILTGHLSPIDGIGPEELGMNHLIEQLQSGAFTEVILATNPTVEGEATAHYLTEQIKPLGIEVSRIAHGVPVGGELEYVDSSTLAHALKGRRTC